MNVLRLEGGDVMLCVGKIIATLVCIKVLGLSGRVNLGSGGAGGGGWKRREGKKARGRDGVCEGGCGEGCAEEV